MTAFNDIPSTSANFVRDLGDRAGDVAQAVSIKMQETLKSLKHLPKTTQEHLESGRSHLQSKWEDSSQHVRGYLAQIGSQVQDRKQTAQKRRKSHQRQHARSRALFRWGLVIGCVAALMYTPVVGAEIRRRLARFWKQETTSAERAQVRESLYAESGV